MPLVRLPAAALAAAALLVAVPAGPAAAQAAPWPDAPAATVGKLVWEAEDGRLGQCSGALVDAPNGSVVATAAHCVRTPQEPQPPSEVWFVPGYHRDAADYRDKGWRVAAFHTPDGWDVSGGMTDVLPHDYAFLTLERRGGRSAQETHGANRVTFEPVPEEGRVAALGYPAAAPYDGETLHACEGEIDVLTEGEAQTPNLGGLLLRDCNLTAGTSGGPWLRDWDPAAGSGTLIAVMSVGSGHGDVIGRPFPEAARELLARAGG
ncbi:trypsin-like peptidase domain-containing protein [Streptomyces sp. DSM 44917]|uniref:Trypsin-like peptidase domain-containing protein n=1 Tax=Streptomyces boetiae TaxID=3075541 RepID=A0ABU2LEQ4_9ACTN|nr:trypsin-like peptidase domain-containing protein [Streptomyces sp. DSM 44917]MDT0309748.1 trypsin-like peptidase domain-containing protein [Streptomyces sp. DSM 44917]